MLTRDDCWPECDYIDVLHLITNISPIPPVVEWMDKYGSDIKSMLGRKDFDWVCNIKETTDRRIVADLRSHQNELAYWASRLREQCRLNVQAHEQNMEIVMSLIEVVNFKDHGSRSSIWNELIDNFSYSIAGPMISTHSQEVYLNASEKEKDRRVETPKAFKPAIVLDDWRSPSSPRKIAL